MSSKTEPWGAWSGNNIASGGANIRTNIVDPICKPNSCCIGNEFWRAVGRLVNSKAVKFVDEIRSSNPCKSSKMKIAKNSPEDIGSVPRLHIKMVEGNRGFAFILGKRNDRQRSHNN